MRERPIICNQVCKVAFCVTEFTGNFISLQSLQYSKQLIRGMDAETLHRANERECELLEERWQSQECFTAIMNFFQRQADAKAKL